jgi:hypothetical protein
MIIQVVLGVWLIVSPFALGFREITSMALNDIILGAIVAILGLFVVFVELPQVRRWERKTR